MIDSNLPVLDNTITQLLLASHQSLDPTTADFMLRRVVPITIYIDGDYERLAEIADDLTNEIARMMAEDGYRKVGEWGPFSGSHLTTIFHRGDEWESGPELVQHLRDWSARFRRLIKQRLPDSATGIRVVLVVGTYVVGVFGAATVAAALPIAVPVAVIQLVAHTVETVAVMEEISHAFGLKPFERFRYDF